VQQNPVKALHGRRKTSESDKGTVVSSSGGIYTDKLPHPPLMSRYDDLCSDPEVRIGIDLLTDMIVGVSPYVEMGERDEKGEVIDSEHPNKAVCEEWARGKKQKFREIVRTKIEKGFCPVELLPDLSLKVLPPESFFIWRDAKGTVLRYTQEVAGSEVARWESKQDMNSIILFFHNADTSHAYGRSIVEAIAGLIDARKQINIDMPKIIHRYSRPQGIWECSRGVDELYTSVMEADVDEDIFIPNVQPDELRHSFAEPSSSVRFIPYIEMISTQIGQAIHAPLFLLLKNATEASATKMMESVDNFVKGEQEDYSFEVQQRFFTRLCRPPLPRIRWGAPKAIYDSVTLDSIGALQANGTLTWEQAQDLIRQKGLNLIEAEKPEPQPLPIITPDQEKPLLNAPQMKQLESSLNVIRDSFIQRQITVTEAIREGERAIKAFVDKSKHESLRKLSEALGKPVTVLSPESERCFTLIRNEIFDQFREALLPTKVPLLKGELTQGGIQAGDKSFTVIAHT
jgi:hypothetical protein